MEQDQNIHQLIIRLLSGEANGQEKGKIELWLKGDSMNFKFFNEVREIWLSSGVECNSDHYHLDEAIHAFRQKTSFLKGKAEERKHFYQLSKYAAILFLAIMIPVCYYIGRKVTDKSDTFTTISCEQGDKTSIVLPDQTLVFLNSGSKLTFSNNFKDGQRWVSLDGEAYFSVRKDSDHPFLVKTSAIRVEVLGTEFDLKAYSNEKIITATLVKGSLKVTDRYHSVIIKPNQKLIFYKENQKMKLLGLTDLSSEVEWKNGRLAFQNQSLEELEQELERWFDVEIEFADEQVKLRRFTGTFEHESILEVISYFGRSSSVAYNIKDNVIIFYTEQ